ncbi:MULTISPECIES: glycoside hydrolase family 94 protein [unclassified Pantoea]|uniref:glycoside hydrolase family 94 protein n=1 Tax=unclassified Pantoea TaxID=2630326 RepID=UPI001CD2BE9E|nr:MULTISPECIES: glycoside hydrolase family 94 protein [unclassified Pantoea]MCA1179860.1 cyclic beta 1-2 glucan synthetase [Pantoea sp. alder69]MCA1253842.1 cyclic beta 1-2 glucan synthetase [Pantoea sp. alder70]MCA1268346.1 cyclic beta 1-2 glucan synthetase [Pantoea sp. alder81]
MKLNPSAWFTRFRVQSEISGGAVRQANKSAHENNQKSELFSTAQMERYGEKLARIHKLSPYKLPYHLLKRLGDNEAVITRNCYEINSAAKTAITPAGDWLLDNYYLIEEQIRMVRQHLPKSFGKGLPSLISPDNCPRIYHIAAEAIAHGDGRWDPASLSGFIWSYQKVTPLALGEIWALPGMLRLALIENLRRISMDVVRAQQDRNIADLWITRIFECADRSPSDLIMVVADLANSRPDLSSAFVAELVRRLQGHGNVQSLPLAWVDQCLAEQGTTSEILINVFNQQLAASQLSVSNSIAGLRLVSETKWADFAESISVVERELRSDPAGIYPKMHFDTRDHYRHVVEILARDSRLSEPEVASRIVALTSQNVINTPEHHIGFYLIGDGRKKLEICLLSGSSPLTRLRHSFTRISLLSWLGCISLFTTALTAGILRETLKSGTDVLLFILVLPLLVVVSQLVSDLLSDAFTRFREPSPLPRMDFSDSIPPDSATMIVIPCMLISYESFSKLLRSLEVCWLGNQNENICFALLTDFADSEHQSSPEGISLLTQSVSDMLALNQKYPSRRPRFYLLHRQPEWNPIQRIWMGFERKRGKLAVLNDWLRHPSSQFVSVADMPADLLPGHIKYVITLDSDTVLPRDTVHKLVATMAHPLNKPEYDPVSQRVVKGYGILQPGLAEELPRSGQGRYAALRSAVPGNNPYTMMSSDVYQDLFGEGSFLGKGIYDVDIFIQATMNTCPENLVLSHDLLEGCYARSGLVSEVLLYEQYPNNYLSDVGRRSRWIRGDWQLLNWLNLRVRKADGTRSRNPLSPLSYWKLIDNLRRSLVAPCLFLLLFTTLLWVPNPSYWFGLLLIIWLLPALFSMSYDFLHKPFRRQLKQHLVLVAYGALKRLSGIGLNVAILPHEAGYSLYAIMITLWRLGISRRNLSEWTSHSSDSDKGSSSVARFYKSMWMNVVSGMLLAVLTTLVGPHLLPIALPVTFLWCLTPLLMSWLSLQPVQKAFSPNQQQKRLLRQTSREIWAFFETFTTAHENWLPPDNYQEKPEPAVAHRTSPTNIGLSLMANLTAWDFGYLPGEEVLKRVSLTLDTLDKMEHYRGHLYNWYDTCTLIPLSPRYVSSVDSGNMAGHLLTLREGLSAMRHQPVLSIDRMMAGLDDTLAILEKLCEQHLPPHLIQLRKIWQNASSLIPHEFYKELNKMCVECNHLITQLNQKLIPARWARHLERQLIQHCNEWASLLSWLPASWNKSDLPTLDWLASAHSAYDRSLPESVKAEARARLQMITELEQRLLDHARMDFTFLYNDATNLLTVGYNCETNTPDKSHYDLLPSEIRLTSFLAIATNQLPLKSWYALGRLFTTIDSETALMSWSGSMFEYLMPNLVMPTWPGSLLDKMIQSAVRRQIGWGKERGVPWGVSESGYHAFDIHKNYLYQAFGVPGLGLRRGLADDMVVAPYASFLALMVSPQNACDNLLRLEKNGARGEYGFYEALDYTSSRLATGQLYAVVQSWMAHHQGMAFQSLSHVLHNAPMTERFMSSPVFRSASLLMQERVPDIIELYSPRRHFESHEGRIKPVNHEPRIITTIDSPVPEIQLLSNSHYHLMLTAGGGGYSRWKNLLLTRWRSDTTRDNWGIFCYIRDNQTGDVWCNTLKPTGNGTENDGEVVFTDAGAEFRRTFGTLSVKTQVVVSSEDDIELRRLTIINRGRLPRSLQLTSYAEVVLAPTASDVAHPAFSNLFIQTELIPERDAILCQRRPRSPDEATPSFIHMMVVHGENSQNVSFETDRALFLGRGRTPSDPQAISSGGPLSNTSGAVLDPIVAISHRIIIQPGQPLTLDIIYGISESRQQSMALLEKYRDHPIADRVFELALSHSMVVLRQINASEEDATLFNRLASALLYPSPELRAGGEVISRNRRGQSGLWGWGISGDLPIVLLSITGEENTALVTTLIQAHRYWRLKGLVADLIFLINCPGGYRQGLQNQILELINAGSEASLLDKSGGLYVRNGEHLSNEDKQLLMSVACLYLDDRAGGLNEQLNQRTCIIKPSAGALIPSYVSGNNRHVPWTPDTTRLKYFNGYGGFTEDGGEYQIVLGQNGPTPAPWSNVLSNDSFGSVISEAGQAYTWYKNAHEYRLTPWENDPVSDRSGEAFYLRDEESGEFWSPCTLPARGQGDYLVRHGFGYSIFSHRESGIDSELTVFVSEKAPTKLAILKLSNNSGRTRKISVTGYVEWTLGDSRVRSSPHIVTQIARISGGCGILANNFYGEDGAERTAFFAVSGFNCSTTGDRREFIGRNRSLQNPLAMSSRYLTGKTGAGLDPCGAVQSAATIIDGDQRTFIFVLGAEENPVLANEVLSQYFNEENVSLELSRVNNFWHKMLHKVEVKTPDTSVNLLVNGWLLYQTIACRLMARSGYYQSGGAFGFRDQLQDTLALVHAEPSRLREQILLCASRQFIHGDVQHWWHPPHGNGVRTRCSDDYLWLPYAVCHYVAATEDISLLDVKIPYLEGLHIPPGEESVYDTPAVSDTVETLWLHCVKALRYSLNFGAHGLPLMGSGDWNDGMNRVGVKGKGESVWLGFFLYDILQRFALLAEQKHEEGIALMCHTEAKRLQDNLEAHAWDGEWYRRGYFDDGHLLGAKSSQDCRIDAIAQSWSVLSGAADPIRSVRSMNSLDKYLVDDEHSLIKLLAPPFDGHGTNPGYIQGYLPGVRENGGQYTHGAIWAVMAFARMGKIERAWQLWSMLNPINHTLDDKGVRVYKAEPYVISADVYSVAPHIGRAGWSWYTGSAGWAYRLLTEELLGIKRAGNTLTIHARLPDEWPSFSMTYHYGQSCYQITVSRSVGEGGKILLDGLILANDKILLTDDGNMHIVDIFQC